LPISFLEYSDFCGKGMPGLSVCERESGSMVFIVNLPEMKKIQTILELLALVFLTKVMGSSQQVILKGI